MQIFKSLYVDFKELNNILDYIYEREVQLYQDDLDNFLGVAQKLKIDIK